MLVGAIPQSFYIYKLQVILQVPTYFWLQIQDHNYC